MSERLLPDEELLSVCEKVRELYAIVYDDPSQVISWNVPWLACQEAALYARMGRTEDALEKLKEAAEGARAFDSRPEAWEMKSLLLGNCTDRRQDFETADSRPLCEVMRDKWMAHADFDAVREREEFREIEERLSRIFSAV